MLGQRFFETAKERHSSVGKASLRPGFCSVGSILLEDAIVPDAAFARADIFLAVDDFLGVRAFGPDGNFLPDGAIVIWVE